jgi:hypothetical protein
MAFWIFKTAQQELYDDVPGVKYVFDNTHSTRVRKGDQFLYLDKSRYYSFTAAGVVRQVTTRKPTRGESARGITIRMIYTAHLDQVVWFQPPLTISAATREGRSNRAGLGITDVNRLGWSQSIASIGEEMYTAIISLCIPFEPTPSIGTDGDFAIPDTWGKARVRRKLHRFASIVFARSEYACVVCGSTIRSLLDAAHLSPYAVDVENRGNPANGVCLCKYCHTALDRRVIGICVTGELITASVINDPVATSLGFLHTSDRDGSKA